MTDAAEVPKGIPILNTRLGVIMHAVPYPIKRNGEPAFVYTDMIEGLASCLRGRIKAGHQNVIIIEGETGGGKSTLAIRLCEAMSRDFDLLTDYIYSTTDLKNKLKRYTSGANPCPVNLFDEATVSLNSSNAMKSDDKEIVVLFDTMRSFGWTSILCAPKFDQINKRIRETHCDYRIKCCRRSPIPGYRAKGFFEVYHRHTHDWTGSVYWSFCGYGIYSKLEPEIDKQYQLIKRDHQLQLMKGFVEKGKIED